MLLRLLVVTYCVLCAKHGAATAGQNYPDFALMRHATTRRTERNIRVVSESGPFAPLCENDVMYKKTNM